MKITLIGPVFPYRGGIAQYTALLASALTNEGHTIQLISFRRQYPKWLYPGLSDKDPSYMDISFPAEFILDPFSPFSWYRATQRIRSFAPSLILTQWWTTFWSIPFAYINYKLRVKKYKTVYLIHNVIPHENRIYDKFLSKVALGQGEAFITQNVYEEERLKELIPTAKISKCFFPIYSRFKTKIVSKVSARVELGLPKNDFIFLFFGFVRPYKGLTNLIEAFGELQHTNQNIHLLIAGEFWESEEKYIKKIIELGLKEKVTILNQYIPNEKIPVIFSSSNCLVAPYVGGTQSAVIGVGLEFGLPIIATEVIAASVDDKYCKFIQIITMNDKASLLSAMKKIAEEERNLGESVQGFENEWKDLIEIIENIA